jgi:hypothetical protein
MTQHAVSVIVSVSDDLRTGDILSRQNQSYGDRIEQDVRFVARLD